MQGFILLGTACMGADSAHSVTDAQSRTHTVPNLLVLDGSVFTYGRRGEPHVYNSSARASGGGPIGSGSRRHQGRIIERAVKPRRACWVIDPGGR